MDTIYSNKKYMQSLNAADYYRASTTLRPSVSRALERRSRFTQEVSLLKRNIVLTMIRCVVWIWGCFAQPVNLTMQLRFNLRFNYLGFAIVFPSYIQPHPGICERALWVSTKGLNRANKLVARRLAALFFISDSRKHYEREKLAQWLFN